MMTVGELKKMLEKFEDEQTIMVLDDVYCAGILYEIKKVQETITGPKIFLKN